MVGLADDPDVALQPFDILGQTTKEYITQTLNMKTFAQFFFKIASTRNDAGKSCVEYFLDCTKNRLIKDFGMEIATAQLQSNALARLFINGVTLGMRMRVVWNENGQNKAYMCILGAAVYEDNQTLGWVVNSETCEFEGSYPFDIIKDEWTIPAIYFRL